MWAQDTFTRLAGLSFVAWCLVVLLELWRTSVAAESDEPSDETWLDEHDARDLAHVADLLAQGDARTARYRLERLLDDVEPDWRVMR